MKKVRLGILGLGNIGLTHANSVLDGKVAGMDLCAVADRNPSKRARLQRVRVFDTAEELIQSGLIDALLICTPHFNHTDAGILALKAGLHVLVEKPISAHLEDAERLVAEHKDKAQVFGAVFNQRTDPAYLKIRDLVQSGELGRIQRIAWTATEWFRPECYYSSSAWRATWAGEGGGTLLNQCPHHLDLLQWIFGQPERVRAHCGFGRHHDIEVEDEVTAYLEFKGGATGVFIASTGEAPGTARVEIAGDKGRLVFEEGRLVFLRNAVPTSQFSKETQAAFGKPTLSRSEIPFGEAGGQHVALLINFASAILEGTPLIAPAEEGLRSLELANAMILSTWQDKTLSLPLDSAVYSEELKKRIANSRFKTKIVVPTSSPADLSKSFAR